MKRFDKGDGTGVIRTGYGAWEHPVACKALCEDGRIRTVRLNQDADTFFSWPGRVTFGKATRRGIVTADDTGRLLFKVCA